MLYVELYAFPDGLIISVLCILILLRSEFYQSCCSAVTSNLHVQQNGQVCILWAVGFSQSQSVIFFSPSFAVITMHGKIREIPRIRVK